MSALEQLEEGLHLLLEAKANDKAAIETRFRQSFWNLSGEDLSDGAINVVRFATKLARTEETRPTRQFLFALLLEATDGDTVWKAIKTFLSPADILLMLALLEQQPGKFSSKSLRDMSSQFSRMNVMEIGEFILTTSNETPLTVVETLDYDMNRKKLLRAVYDLRIKNYTHRSGPALGASFEAEQAALEESIAEAGISDGVLPALRKAHEYLSGHQDDFSFKTSMDLTRTAYEETIRSCAEKVGIEPAMTGGQTLSLLKKHGKLTEEEWELAKGLYGFLSERGTHTLKSEHQEAKVTLFMVIEYSQYLIGTLVPAKQEQS